MKYTGFHRVVQYTFAEHQSSFKISLSNEVRTEAMDTLRNTYRSAGQRPPSYTAMVIKGVADTLRHMLPEYPELNAMIVGFGPFKRIHAFDRISAGIAVSFKEHNKDRATMARPPRPR